MEASAARERLTRRRVLEAALRLVDREGAAALSMRRLGRELDVEAMSLYNHVSGRDEVLDGLSEVMVARIGVAGDSGGWAEALGRFMRGIRAVALAHPAAFQLVGMRPLNTREALPQIEAVLGAMR
ncbi:MAG: TetR/AcrR family transcriptional regulator, partial [Gaiellaceae bacterium]